MKTLKNYIWILLLGILLLVFLGLAIGLSSMFRVSVDNKNIVGAIFIDNIDDGGWNEAHYKGLKKACDMFGFKLEIETNIEESRNAAEAAIDELVAKGCNIIFLTSDGYGMDLYPVMEKYRDVQFYTVSPNADMPNATTYFCRDYEMRYLAGIIAGKMTNSNIIGYVAGMRKPQTTRGINAFALGVRSVNPDAIVKVKYMDAWTDSDVEYESAKKLILDGGADFITFHASLHTAIDAAEDFDTYSIGYGSYKEGYSDKNLTTVLYKWDVVYQYILEDISKGNFDAEPYYWLGLRKGAVDLAEYSQLVPGEVKLLVEEKKQEIKHAYDIFEGELISNTGEIMCNKGESISDDALLKRMDWFVEGVEIYE
ncbi:BMP family ABC transporter substrate-binding protein [Butyrivibrio sp. AC2005]|uniref:BMP family ABC transporter substrate-binding protein n=1 Tax=Butyrivibrio sp. AC2005 TaxID=1280672 RepID=UPI000677C7C4|nr:BMP family ABC transporter substrate-binding protein [Butyrivibrio sp. AC2005]